MVLLFSSTYTETILNVFPLCEFVLNEVSSRCQNCTILLDCTDGLGHVHKLSGSEADADAEWAVAHSDV